MDFEAIIARAEEIAHQYNPEGLSPFPYQKIQAEVSDVNIYVASELPSNISGGIGFDKATKGFKVFVNPKKILSHQNFVLAHELGHFFLHASEIKKSEVLIDEDPLIVKNTILGEPVSTERIHIELEANTFALGLLMPEELVTQVWEQLQDISECAHVFNVSLLAMSYRLEQLKLIE